MDLRDYKTHGTSNLITRYKYCLDPKDVRQKDEERNHTMVYRPVIIPKFKIRWWISFYTVQ
jgi:hypothetical protein